MEEKILIKSERYNMKVLLVIALIGLALLPVWMLVRYGEMRGHGVDAIHFEKWFFRPWLNEFTITSYLVYIVPLILIACLLYLWLRSYELTVTDKRVYGKIAFGKRVDLPVDSVSAISTLSLLKGIAVATSSGKISFNVLKNANEIYDVLNNLIIERQSKQNNEQLKVVATPATDEADQLRKYKGLLDSGVITQEEFDAKKKQLLGL
ncbi:MAG: SHOCT domain-containing protein [Clostridia bacterium]|nr:SHOCT domain-containing protein [Clostridia bacterium]